MIERSIYSTKYIFVENSFREGLLTDLENIVLTQWHDHILKTQDMKVDLFVYLRAPPEICYERLKARNRKEEVGVPYEFIEKLHDLHEDWLINQTINEVPGPVLVLDASHELPKMKEIYEEHRSRILCGCTNDSENQSAIRQNSKNATVAQTVSTVSPTKSQTRSTFAQAY